jgi:fermentation-respiration switch protein FrsA (DUF1100 family)
MTGLTVYDPISQAPKIRIPVLVFSTDGALIPEQAKKFYDRVKSEKQLVLGAGYHFNFYDVFPEMMQAVDAVVPFMRKHFGAANGLACNQESCTNRCGGNYVT